MVVIGGSAGSLDIVFRIVAALPVNAGATFMIVVHRKNEPDSMLQYLLTSKTTMPVKEVEDKEQIEPNSIYIAPPDYHLLVENENFFALDSSEKIHFCRPSIDVSFESAAAMFKAATIGVLLSGANADGAKGLKTIRHFEGLSIVQDPLTAEVKYMPQEAIKLYPFHTVVPGEMLPEFIAEKLKA